eukprot:TRINITY_DN4827_c0_g1_i1.p1 TRINITY_DN4827_c0_g1~~TRINITY_DN4827_c0_g1_i1.p1  ORF type:complete len:250 (+),score=36.24 TRINITY_DN4827_c0_g1_i1:30-752(+)
MPRAAAACAPILMVVLVTVWSLDTSAHTAGYVRSAGARLAPATATPSFRTSSIAGSASGPQEAASSALPTPTPPLAVQGLTAPASGLLGVPLAALGAIVGLARWVRRGPSPVLQPLLMTMAAAEGEKPAEGDKIAMPSVGEMMQMIAKLGGPGALQEAAKSIPPDLGRRMADATRQLMTKGAQGMTPDQQQAILEAQVLMLKSLQKQGITLPDPMLRLLDSLEAAAARGTAPPADVPPPS